MKHLLLLLICLSLSPSGVRAAFRYHPPRAEERRVTHNERGPEHGWGHFLIPTLHRRDAVGWYRGPLFSNIEGDISFLMGVAGAVIGLLYLFGILVTPLAICIGVVAGIIALILGAKGYKKWPRGFAIAGLWLGIVEVGLAAIILVFGAAILLWDSLLF